MATIDAVAGYGFWQSTGHEYWKMNKRSGAGARSGLMIVGAAAMASAEECGFRGPPQAASGKAPMRYETSVVFHRDSPGFSGVQFPV
jgi:hypothetical protein